MAQKKEKKGAALRNVQQNSKKKSKILPLMQKNKKTVQKKTKSIFPKVKMWKAKVAKIV